MRVLLAALLCLAGFARAAPPEALQDLVMVDASVGWGLGVHKLYRTDDGGTHWHNVPFGRAAAETFCALGRGASRAAVWVACSPLASSLVTQAEGTLYQTRTAGASWAQSPLPLGGGVYVQRLNQRLGYLTAAIAEGMGHVAFGFARTLGGGRNWQVQNTGNRGPLGQNGQTFPVYDAKGNGYLGISPYARTGFMLVLRSWNAGQSWAAVRVAAPEPSTVMTPEIPVVFGQTVLVAAQLERLQTNAQGRGAHSFALYASYDGGKTYHGGQRVKFAALPDWPPQLKASFIGARQGFIAAGRTLYRTDDAGKHWRKAGKLPAEPVTRLTFIGVKTGWLLTRRALYRTRDGGLHWQPL